MPFVDPFLNKITMYRLVLYGLIATVVWALGMSLLGQLSYNPLHLLGSLAILLVVCYGTNNLIARLLKAPTNVESWGITALILFLTLAPILDGVNAFYIAAAGAGAMASKYLLAVRKRHVFNPAAFGLFLLSVTGIGLATWWVASPVMLPIVLMLGVLIVRKIRRFDTFLPFFAAATLLYIGRSMFDGTSLSEAFSLLILSGPIIFMGTVMLTEPFTMPPSRTLRVVYGVLVGLLFASHFSLGPLYSTPHLALLVGNLYAFVVGSRQRLMLTLRRREEVAPGVFEFVFSSNEELRFEAGQYLEWTLPHKKADTRGNRRYLSISSAPNEGDIRFATRIGERSSSFKKALLSLSEGSTLSAASLAGDFTLPKDAAKPLVCIAGGIGITPFASMLREMAQTGVTRPITLIYAANSEQDFAFKGLIDEVAAAHGIKLVYLAGTRLTEEVLRKEVSDLGAPTFYISGPDVMVRANKALLRSLRVPLSHIKTDYFPGL